METPAFRGRLNFCSNFHPCVIYDEMCIKYECVENAYQASKTLDKDEREKISKLTAANSKRYFKNKKIRNDWNDVKLPIMEFFLKQKFIKGGKLANLLLNTGDEHLEEKNPWHDTFWGTCNGIGSNHLGKLLMKIRKELKNDC